MRGSRALAFEMKMTLDGAFVKKPPLTRVTTIGISVGMVMASRSKSGLCAVFIPFDGRRLRPRPRRRVTPPCCTLRGHCQLGSTLVELVDQLSEIGTSPLAMEFTTRLAATRPNVPVTKLALPRTSERSSHELCSFLPPGQTHRNPSSPS